MLKKLLTNSLIYGIAPNIPKVAALFILPLLTAHLTEEDYGIAGTIVAYTMALSALSTLGFNVILQNSYFKDYPNFKILWRHIYGFLQIWMIGVSIIQSIILYFIIPDQAIVNRWWIILLTNFNGVIFGPAGFIGPWYYQLEQRPVPIGVRSLIAGFLTLIINYITIVIFNWGYMGWYVSSFLGTFVVNISYWYVLSYKLDLSPIYHFDRGVIKSKLKISLPMIPHYYTYFLINTSGRLVMDWNKIGLDNIGKYNIAQQITSYFETGVSALERAVGPMSLKSISEKNIVSEKRVIYIFTISVFALAFLISLWCKEILSILVKNVALANAYPYAVILIMALCYRPLYVASSNIYFFHENTKSTLTITFLPGLVSFIVNLIVIPIYGLWGAVIVNYVTFLWQGYFGFTRDFYKSNRNAKINYKLCLMIQVLLTVISFHFMEYPIDVKIVISIIEIIISSVIFIKIIRIL